MRSTCLKPFIRKRGRRQNQPIFEATGKTLREEYADLSTLRIALPELILRHNLHGIDIDLRACQIAALALWLRAQHGLPASWPQELLIVPRLRAATSYAPSPCPASKGCSTSF